MTGDELKKMIAQQDEYIRYEYTRLAAHQKEVREKVKAMSEEITKLTDRVGELELELSDKPRKRAKKA